MLSTFVSRYISQNPCTPHDKAALNGLVKTLAVNQWDYTPISLAQWQVVFSSYATSSEGTLRGYKTAIKKFYRWLERQGEPVEETLSSLNAFCVSVGSTLEIDDNEYFGSFDHLCSALNHAMLTDVDECGTYLLDVCMLFLAWFGVAKEVALNLYKSDITFEKDVCQIAKFCTLRNPRAVHCMSLYFNASSFSRADTSSIQYVSSPYLFRTSASAHLTLNDYRGRLNTFNKLSEKNKCQRRFSYEKVHRSATFAKSFDVLQMRKIPIEEKPDPSLMSLYEHLFETTFSRSVVLYRKYGEFYSWCKKFRPDAFPSEAKPTLA